MTEEPKKESEFKSQSCRCHRCALFYLSEDGCPYLGGGQNGETCPHFVMYKALEELRKVFHKWFKYEDETLLDLCLAVKIHSLQLDKYVIPLWLIIIGASGDRKSSTVINFYDDGKETYFLNYLTPNTLASGQKKNVKRDLAPRLDRKLVITGDMAQFLKLDSRDKGKIWSQLREAYEGRVQKDTGSGVHTFYEGVRWDWISCATPIIDEELLLKNELGTRELVYRMPEENEDQENKIELMKAILQNIDLIEQRDKELKDAIKQYFVWWKRQEFNVEVSDDTERTLMQYADFVTQLRVSAECDWQSGDLTNFVYPEKPTRILQQFMMLYKCLKQLDPDYSDETALDRIFEVVKSCIHPVRLKILQSLREVNEGLSTTKLAHKVGLAYKTTNRELQICRHLGLVTRDEGTIEGGSAFIWHLNRTHPIACILNKFDEKPQLDSKLEVQQKLGGSK